MPAGRFAPFREIEHDSGHAELVRRRAAASASPTTCSATPRPRSRAASTSTWPVRPPATRRATTRWRCSPSSRSWTDRNRDNIAQDSEIGPPTNARFGQPVQTVRPGDDLQREYDWVYNLGVQHELRARPGASPSTGSVAAPTTCAAPTISSIGLNDYNPVPSSIRWTARCSPSTTSSRRSSAQVDQVDVNSTDSDLRSRTYNGIEFGFNGRLRAASFFGGYTFYRTIDVECDNISDPNTFRFCDQAHTACRGGTTSSSPARTSCRSTSSSTPPSRAMPATSCGSTGS